MLQSLYKIMSVTNSIVNNSSLTVRLFKMKNHYSTQCCRTVIEFCRLVVELFSNYRSVIDMLSNYYRVDVEVYRIVVETIANCCRIVHLLLKFIQFVVDLLPNCRLAFELLRIILQVISNCVEMRRITIEIILNRCRIV